MTERTLEATGGLFGFIIAAFWGSWQIVIVLLVLYGIFLLCNLITGLLYAFQTNTYDRQIAFKATLRKAGVLIGIFAFMVLDWVLIGLCSSFNIAYKLPFLYAFFTSYQAMHEFTSMLTNLKKLGNKIPTAIEKAAKKAADDLDRGKIPGLPNFKGDEEE